MEQVNGGGSKSPLSCSPPQGTAAKSHHLREKKTSVASIAAQSALLLAKHHLKQAALRACRYATTHDITQHITIYSTAKGIDTTHAEALALAVAVAVAVQRQWQ